MDVIDQEDLLALRKIAEAEDQPLLMLNFNRYTVEDYSQNALYLEWRNVNQAFIDHAKGKILWALPILGQTLSNNFGVEQPVHELLAYWYPSHSDFLNLAQDDVGQQNFALRAQLIDFAYIYRCDGLNVPSLS